MENYYIPACITFNAIIMLAFYLDVKSDICDYKNKLDIAYDMLWELYKDRK